MKDFLFTLFAWLLTLPLIAAALIFALYNSDPVPVTLNPFYEPAQWPVYVPVLGAVAFGFLFGALMTWAAMGRLRLERREARKRIKALEKQLDEQNKTPAPTPSYPMIAPEGY